MNVDAAAAGKRGAALELTLLKLAVLYLLVVKLAFATLVPPNADEAYYWLWGQHLQWSYFDHSPLVGWTAGLAHLVMGWSFAAMRLPAFVSLLVIIYAMHGWSRRVAPADSDRFFWVLVAVWLASPLIDILTTLNYPDHLLICFSVLALVRFSLYLAEQRDGGKPRLADLYLGAVFLGFAALGKYNAAFVGLALVVALVAVPRYRPLLASPHTYLAGALSLAIASPILFWNIANGFPTLEYHAVERFSGGRSGINLFGTGRVLLLSVLYMSPFLIWALLRPLFGRVLPGAAGSMQHLGRPLFILSTASMLALSAWGAASSQVAPHWNVLAFVPFMLLVPFFLRSRFLLWAHMVLGMLSLTLATAYYLGSPVVGALVGQGPGEAGVTWGYDQLAEAARAARTETGAELYAGTSYTGAAKLAVGLGSDKDVVSLGGGRHDQFDYWRDAAADAGKDVIVLTNANTRATDIAGSFESVELLRRVETSRFGQPLVTYQLFLGRGYKP